MFVTGNAAGVLILLGKITKPHGIRGEVKVYPYTDQPENFHQYREVFAEGDRGGEWMPLTIEKARIQNRQVILRIHGCEDREAAENLAGREIGVNRRDLSEPGEDEFYLADLQGRTALTEKGRILGRITGIIETGAQNILSITGKGQEYLIPIDPDFIVDLHDQQVILRVPPGLLDINS